MTAFMICDIAAVDIDSTSTEAKPGACVGLDRGTTIYAMLP